MQRVYAYVRVSTVKQGQTGSSLREQTAAIEQYAATHNLQIIRWFEEQETAAKRGRPVFGRLVKLLRSHPGAGVIIHKIDRSARNLKDWSDLGELIDQGIPVHFAHESLDLQSRGGRLAADIQAVVAADFIRNLRDEVKKGMRGRLKQGLYPLPAPLGYLNQGKGLPKLPDPKMAPLIRQLFEWYATGSYNLYQLGQAAYAVGLRNRAGSRVSRNGLSTLLNNEFYCGVIHIRRTGERYAGVHEPIISAALFRQVQAVLRGRKVPVSHTHGFLFRRMLRCAACGYALIGERQRGHIYYRCHSRMCRGVSLREDRLLEQIHRAFAPILLSLSTAERLTEALRQARKRAKPADDTRAARLRLQSIEQKMVRLTDSYLEGLLEKEIFRQRQARLLHEQAAAQEQLKDKTKKTEIRQEAIKAYLEQLMALQSHKSAEATEMRDMLVFATSNISVAGKMVCVAWKKQFSVISEFAKSQYSIPAHSDSRSRNKLPQKATSLVKPLVQAIMRSLEEECGA